MTATAAQGRRSLWLPADVQLLYSLNVLGVALLLASAWATTASDDLSARVAWVNLGVVGLLVAAVGNSFWLLAGRRAVGERRVRLLAAPHDHGVAGNVDRRSVSDAAPARLCAVAGGSRYHRPGCALVVDKSVVVGARSRHERAGRRPCGVCEP